MTNTCLRTSLLLILTSLTTHPAWAENPVPTPLAPPAAPVVAAAVQVAPTPQVARSAFTTGITAHEPDSQLARISAGQEVYYFTELTGLQGHVITHRWEKDGAFQLGLQFPVGGQRWRVHSSKNITANLPGTWTVTVQNDDGAILRQDTLVVDPVMPAASVAPTVSAAPVIPPPAQPLTNIPPELQKEPVARPAQPVPAATPEPAPVKSTQPIWNTLPH